MTDQKNDNSFNSQKPPFFKGWKQVYSFVMAVFAILVALFYLFTKTFS